MKVFCLAGIVKSNLFHITCATCNIFSHFSYSYALIQFLENVQVDENVAETTEIRISHLQLQFLFMVINLILT